MCGISALIAGVGPLDPRRLVAMSGLVRHRGPDDEGYVAFAGRDLAPGAFGGPDTPRDCFAGTHPFLPADSALPPAAEIRVALGHRRLSIVDLSPAGHQPMCTPDRDLWIAHNGEVYNHIELRRELEALGHAFRSHSDTEVMLVAYRQWGTGCLERFNGMFAFVLIDRARRRLLAARDRFGVKPLYLWRSPRGELALASEIKQFTALEGWRARLNGQRAYDFLVWGASEHTSETMFEGVRQLRGGELAEIDLEVNSAPKISRWYELGPRPFAGGREQAAGEFRDLLTDSVKLRLRADVAVGSCLSGGLDSSSIVCVANRLLRESGGAPMQKTFSALSDSPRYDERRYAEEVVRATGVSAATVTPSPEGLFEELDAIAWHQDEPFGSTSIYAQWEVFRLAAARGVKVMLDGQGADEALGGYPVFHGARLAGLARGLAPVALVSEIAAMRRVQGISTGSSLRQMAASLAPAWLLSRARRWAGDEPAPAWLDVGRLGAQPVHPYAAEERSPRNSMQSLSRSQLLEVSLPMLLHLEDRNSMAHSIEARVPFLDYRLVEFALGLPDERKISGGVTKMVLRDAMRGILPEAVRGRTDKLGFQMAEDEWMNASPNLFRAALGRAVESSGGTIRPVATGILDDMLTGRMRFSFLAWRLIAFGAWMRRYAVRPAG